MLTFLKNGKGKILHLFFKNPDREFYLREIARELKQEPGFFQAPLNALVKEGLLIDERKANLRFFKLNKNHPLYEEIKKIVSKTLGMEAKLKELAEGLEKIEYAFIFGSIAKNQEYSESDIDLLLIGEANQDFLIEKIRPLEEDLNREVNYHIYSKEEIIKKLEENNDFITRIFNEPKIILKGDLYDFGKFN
ncbi:nucleotidyltransferase domain-containing protein [Candidatus Parcubacteria bacterium]|nr:nucleotidyltransferase domain-containing protein [Patescibacteria group bacterium]MCG2694006.1 nucleotidyltransferase domain-containing protein [Candidatus Parcubacteria bacterium]